MMQDYEMVIGLEVHVELKTETKIFCGCSTAFGAAPNTQCCPVCMGLPGTLPVLNEKVVEYAVRAGLATHCTIARYSKQDRKNYFYPDLPKAYQISQYDLPLCEHGYLEIQTSEGEKRIGITRIHIEEDAGKLVHKEGGGTLCDYNRCGVPLIEIVSEPDIRSAEEAKQYVRKLRAIMMYTGVSDCKMQEGSLRCDVNLSVRKKGETAFGTRTEMKNLNSFQFIGKAIEYEFTRQVKALEAGEEIVQETRRFDQQSGKTFSMRRKENADDYRYFPDPDLIPVITEQAWLDEMQQSIPQLPDDRKKNYMEQYGLSAADADLLTADLLTADYFEAAACACDNPKTLAHLMLGEMLKLLPADAETIPIRAAHMAELCQLLTEDKINNGTAKKLVKQMWQEDRAPSVLAEEQQLWQINDASILQDTVQRVMKQDTKSVADFHAGKTNALKALIGRAMQETGGQANPKLLAELMENALKESEVK